MSSHSTECSKLCRLIDPSLRSFTEEEEIVLKSKEKEKDILVALSQFAYGSGLFVLGAQITITPLPPIYLMFFLESSFARFTMALIEGENL